jgi:hypothetical protein
MSILRGKPDYPDFYSATLAYNLEFEWGSVNFTEQAAVANKLWPVDHEAAALDFDTFKGRVDSRTSGLSRFDVLVAGQDEISMGNELSALGNGLMAYTVEDRSGLQMVTTLPSEISDNTAIEATLHPANRNVQNTEAMLRSHMLGSVVGFWISSAYAEWHKVTHSQRLLKQMRVAGQSWLLANAALVSGETALGTPGYVYAGVPTRSAMAFGIKGYRMLKADLGDELAREQDWLVEGRELGNIAHDEIERAFVGTDNKN